MAFYQSSGKKEDQHYTVSSTNSLSVVESWAIFQDCPPRCNHHHLVQKQGRKVRFLQILGNHSALHRIGRWAIFQDCPPRCNHRHLVQKQGRKVRLLQILGNPSALHRRKILAPPEAQCWFKANRGTRDMVSVLSSKRNARSRTKDCSFCEPDQSRNGLWMIMEHLGYTRPSSSAWLLNYTKTSSAKLG